jgi:coproporphyrinogen III oxidase-like Fe-S oxidoreductase
MLEKTLVRYVYRRNLRTLSRLRGTADPVGRSPPRAPVLLYLHVPFCRNLCGFCTFNRVAFQEGLARRYFEALRKEISIYAARGYSFASLYVGGGTPTVLPEELATTIAQIRSRWNLRVVSVETHLDDLTENVCSLLREAGVNRLSVGVQSFQERVLHSLDRHSPQMDGCEARRRLARSIARFPIVNVDMILNASGETDETLRRDVQAINDLLPQQVTFNPLMGGNRSGPPRLPPRERYAFLREGLSGRYRLSSGWSFSLAGAAPLDEYIMESESYAGLGSGSFGYLDGTFYANTFSIPEYLRTVAAGELPVVVSRSFGRAERMRYSMLMGMFHGSLDSRELIRKFGFFPLLPLLRECLMTAAAGGLRWPGRASLRDEGTGYVSMLIMLAFFSAVGEFREICRGMSIGGC